MANNIVVYWAELHLGSNESDILRIALSPYNVVAPVYDPVTGTETIHTFLADGRFANLGEFTRSISTENSPIELTLNLESRFSTIDLTATNPFNDVPDIVTFVPVGSTANQFVTNEVAVDRTVRQNIVSRNYARKPCKIYRAVNPQGAIGSGDDVMFVPVIPDVVRPERPAPPDVMMDSEVRTYRPTTSQIQLIRDGIVDTHTDGEANNVVFTISSKMITLNRERESQTWANRTAHCRRLIANGLVDADARDPAAACSNIDSALDGIGGGYDGTILGSIAAGTSATFQMSEELGLRASLPVPIGETPIEHGIVTNASSVWASQSREVLDRAGHNVRWADEYTGSLGTRLTEQVRHWPLYRADATYGPGDTVSLPDNTATGSDNPSFRWTSPRTAQPGDHTMPPGADWEMVNINIFSRMVSWSELVCFGPVEALTVHTGGNGGIARNVEVLIRGGANYTVTPINIGGSVPATLGYIEAWRGGYPDPAGGIPLDSSQWGWAENQIRPWQGSIEEEIGLFNGRVVRGRQAAFNPWQATHRGYGICWVRITMSSSIFNFADDGDINSIEGFPQVSYTATGSRDGGGLGSTGPSASIFGYLDNSSYGPGDVLSNCLDRNSFMIADRANTRNGTQVYPRRLDGDLGGYNTHRSLLDGMLDSAGMSVYEDIVDYNDPPIKMFAGTRLDNNQTFNGRRFTESNSVIRVSNIRAEDVINGAEGSFPAITVSEEDGSQQGQGYAVVNNTSHLNEDLGIRSSTTVDLSFLSSEGTPEGTFVDPERENDICERLNLEVERSRIGSQGCTVNTDLVTGRGVRLGDIIEVSYGKYEWVARHFRVVEITDDARGRLTFTCQYFNDFIYAGRENTLNIAHPYPYTRTESSCEIELPTGNVGAPGDGGDMPPTDPPVPQNAMYLNTGSTSTGSRFNAASTPFVEGVVGDLIRDTQRPGDTPQTVTDPNDPNDPGVSGNAMEYGYDPGRNPMWSDVREAGDTVIIEPVNAAGMTQSQFVAAGNEADDFVVAQPVAEVISLSVTGASSTDSEVSGGGPGGGGTNDSEQMMIDSEGIPRTERFVFTGNGSDVEPPTGGMPGDPGNPDDPGTTPPGDSELPPGSPGVPGRPGFMCPPGTTIPSFPPGINGLPQVGRIEAANFGPPRFFTGFNSPRRPDQRPAVVSTNRRAFRITL